MVLILLRHGQSVWNRANILTGWTDVMLSSDGTYEAIKAASLVKNFNFDYIFASDLIRTIDTATIIKNELKLNTHIETSSALKERDYGLLTGYEKNELSKFYSKEDTYNWKNTYYGRPPNGENLEDVQKRFGNYFDNNIKSLLDDKKNILIVSHSNSLRAFFVHLGLKNERTIENFEIQNCIPIIVNIYKKSFTYITDKNKDNEYIYQYF